MKSRIELKDMNFYAYHGVFPQETLVGNHFVVNLNLTAPLEKAVESDELDDTLNYAEIYRTVQQEMETPSRLLEHVGGRILKSLKTRFPMLTKAEVKITKLNPPFGGDLHSASIILTEKW
ncbi:MAG: dihydroneopterin aldolase [Tannerellaceae bacterium]|nr:dihydroneopterin aldolase [Tannerellaceae bacterium]